MTSLTHGSDGGPGGCAGGGGGGVCALRVVGLGAVVVGGVCARAPVFVETVFFETVFCECSVGVCIYSIVPGSDRSSDVGVHSALYGIV